MSEAEALSGRRLLIVEDDMLIAMMIEDILRDCGCDVVGPVRRLVDALTLARQEALDGAVLDLNLAGERADPVAGVLRDRGIPFVIVTGYGPEAGAEHFPDVPLLAKPFDPEVLPRVVARAIRHET